MKNRGWIPVLALACCAGWLSAQTAGRFEAISIRPNRSGALSSDTDTSPGRLRFVNVTPISLLLRAFGVQQSQIIGAPGWVSSERYDVLAVTGGADRLNDKERQPLLQAMLAERWGLRYHKGSRQMSVYSLVIAKGGSKLQVHTGPGEYGMKVTTADGQQTLNSTKGNIPRLVEILSRATGKIVVDETRLTGEYDFRLEWAQDLAAETAGPSLTTALRDQLGLQLTSAKRPVDVFVIDNITRPTEN